MDAFRIRIPTILPAIASRILSGALLAVVLGQVLTIWITTCGTSPASVLAACTAASVSGLLWLLLRSRLPTTLSLPATAILTGSVCAFSFSAPRLTELLLSQLSSLTFSAGEFAGFTAFLLSAVGCCSLVLLTATLVDAPNDDRPQFWFLAGMACGFVSLLLHASRTFPLSTTVALLALAGFGVRIAVTPRSTTSRRADGHPLEARRVVGAIASGIVLVAVVRLVAVLVPQHANLLIIAAAELCLLAAVSRLPLIRRFLPTSTRGWLSVIGVSSLPLLFNWLMDLNLRLTASTDSVGLLLAARAAQVAIPCWLAIAAGSSPGDAGSLSRFRVPGILAGCAAALLLAHAGLPAKALLALGLIVIVLLRTTDLRITAPTFKLRVALLLLPVGAAASVVAAVAMPLDSAAPARLLFRGQTFQALRAGMDRNLIPVADSARLHEHTESATVVQTTWRLSGDLIELRRNGIACGLVSTNTFTTPQPVADVAAAVLGLTIHPAPGNVLILGDESGLHLRTCCYFPLATITAVRESAATTSFAERFAWTALHTQPADDDRVFIEHVPASLAIRQRDGRRFDVVLAATAGPFSTNAQSQLTEEFYRAAAARLTPDGVLSQRFRQHDLGAEPLVVAISTLSAVFNKVAAVQVVPGEIVLLATNSETPLLDEGFLARLQKEHVRRELGRSGWDWAQLAGLPVIDAQDPIGLFDHEPLREPATGSNGRFVFGLPLDAERWGNKAAELRDMFAPHQMRIAEATPFGPAHDEFRRRISAVAQQSEILANFPDQPWPYRTSLKMEMQRNPRPPVETVRDGEILRSPHPLDELRKDYFVALGNALKTAGGEASTKPKSVEALNDVRRFTLQYEPLVSHFAHHELVRLHEMTDHPAPADELQHRLHTVYFHEPGDYSVRHIAAAIDHLLELPDPAPSAADRFDHLNALLQELVERWQARTQYEPKSSAVVQNDISDCVRAANRALDELEVLADEVGVSRTGFLARRRFINTVLISRLRSYGDEILAHRMKHRLPADSPAEVAGGDPDDLPLLFDPAELSTN